MPLHIKCLWSVKLHVSAHARMSSLCVIIQPDLMHCKSVYMCVDGIDFQWTVVMYLRLDSCFLAGVTKRPCVCVWACSERSHSSPALTYLRLHEAKTASMISFSEPVYSHRNNDCSHISIISILLHQHSKWLGAKLLCFLMHHHSNEPYVAKQPLNSTAS